MAELADIQNSEDIKLLVDSFYQKVLSDQEIGHFFTQVVPISMEEHMPTMYSFWESVLFYDGKYRGNPMQKHIELNQKSSLHQAHFQRWLNLWKETVQELFKGKKAEEAVAKSQQIAAVMQMHVFKS